MAEFGTSLVDAFAELDPADVHFRERWLSLLASKLVDARDARLEDEGETSATLLRGALALECVFQALSVLPETADAVRPLFDLQLVVANARFGAPGGLTLKDLTHRGSPQTAQRQFARLSSAVAIEILKRANPRSTQSEAIREVTAAFRKVGIRGKKGGLISPGSISDWHRDCTAFGTPAYATVLWAIRDSIGLDRPEALSEVRALARDAAAAQKMVG